MYFRRLFDTVHKRKNLYPIYPPYRTNNQQELLAHGKKQNYNKLDIHRRTQDSEDNKMEQDTNQVERNEPEERKITEELPQEELEQAAGGFFGVPTVPVNPIDDELRDDA